jgi:hypothetical protein
VWESGNPAFGFLPFHAGSGRGCGNVGIALLSDFQGLVGGGEIPAFVFPSPSTARHFRSLPQDFPRRGVPPIDARICSRLIRHWKRVASSFVADSGIFMRRSIPGSGSYVCLGSQRGIRQYRPSKRAPCLLYAGLGCHDILPNSQLQPIGSTDRKGPTGP